MESTPSPCVQDIKITLFTNFHALFHKIIPILLIACTNTTDATDAFSSLLQNCLTKAKNAGKNVTKLVEIALGAATWAPAAELDIMMEMVALDPMVAKIDTVVPKLVFDMVRFLI